MLLRKKWWKARMVKTAWVASPPPWPALDALEHRAGNMSRQKTLVFLSHAVIYGLRGDEITLNSLLTFLCRDEKTLNQLFSGHGSFCIL